MNNEKTFYAECRVCHKKYYFSEMWIAEIAETNPNFKCSICANIKLPKEKSIYKGTGLIWQNPDNLNEFCKECPKCHKTIIFRGKCSKNNAISSVRRKRWCRYCSSRGRAIYVWNDERRKYMSMKRKGIKNPNYKLGLYVGKHKRKNQ